MYVRPRQIFEYFLVMERVIRVSDAGRTVTEFRATGAQVLGAVGTAKVEEVEKWRALKHEITHTIVQHRGGAVAKVGDVLVKGNQKFIIEGVGNPAGLGEFFVYYVKERADL